MNAFNELTRMINKLILAATRFHVPRLGKVSKIDDELKKGRILVHIDSLGWDTDNKGAWCYPKDKKGIIIPRLGDYVIVEFLDGNKDFPIYTGIATQMKDMLPKSFDGNSNTQILFESQDNKTVIKIDELISEINILSKNVIILKIDGVEIDIDSTGITLKSGDAASWNPNILAIDPITGLPHGGVTAGIVKLRGG